MNQQLELVLQEMEAATAGLSDGELGTMRLEEGKWSAAEVLEHLRLTFSGTARVMDKVASAPLPVRRATLKEWISTAVVIRLGYMPSGREAPDVARPRQVEVNGILRSGRRSPTWTAPWNDASKQGQRPTR